MPTRRMKSGHWQITFKLPGQPRYRKVHPEARLKSDAELIETRLKQRVFDGKWKPNHGNELFSEFTKTYLAWSHQQKKSASSDVSYIRQIMPTFGHLKLGQITPSYVNEWWMKRAGQITRQGRTPAHITLNRELSQLSGIFTLAIKLGKLEHNPCRRITKYKVDAKRKRVLTPEEERRILEVLDSEFPFMGNIVRLALNTGMRRGEIFQMRFENLDLEVRRNLRGDVLSYGQIDLPGAITKSGKPRTIPLTKEAREILADRAGEPYAVVFNEISPTYASKLFGHACRVTRVAGAVFHSLRHTFGTRLIDRNVNPVVVKEILGHSSLKQTEDYIHIDDTLKQRAVHALSEPPAEVHDIAVAKSVVGGEKH